MGRRLKGIDTMTITEAVNKLLCEMKPGEEFTGYRLQRAVEYHTGKRPFVSSCLRVMRYWRRYGYNVKCLNRQKSLYVIVED